MRNAPNVQAERCRVSGSMQMGNNGHFLVPGPDGNKLFCVVSDGCGWDHVSVSVRSNVIGATKPPRLPTWAEMEHVKRLFFRDDEVAVQIHPTKASYVNNEEVLHLWRSQDVAHPLPPIGMVGVREPEGGDGETVITLNIGAAETKLIRSLSSKLGVSEEMLFQKMVVGTFRVLAAKVAEKARPVDAYEEAASDPL
jgi:hypothetical protein